MNNVETRGTYIASMLKASRALLQWEGPEGAAMRDFCERVSTILQAHDGDADALDQQLIRGVEAADPTGRSAALQGFRQGLIRRRHGRRSMTADPFHVTGALLEAHIAAVRHQPDAGLAMQRRLAQLCSSGHDDGRIDALAAALDGIVDTVPLLLQHMAVAAAAAGIGTVVAPLIEQAAGYLLHADDHLADHSGTLGLLDDVYVVHGYLERINARHETLAGVPLLPQSWPACAELLAIVLGAEIVQQLDCTITHGVNATVQQGYFNQLADWRRTLDATGTEPLDSALTLQRVLAELGLAGELAAG